MTQACVSLQVLNLAPWGNVLLQLPPVRLSGAHGWSSLGTSLGDQWLKEITTNQVSKIPMCAHYEMARKAAALADYRQPQTPNFQAAVAPPVNRRASVLIGPSVSDSVKSGVYADAPGTGSSCGHHGTYAP